ncbi:TonB family protein [Prevotella sp. PMUR]|uniref:TonB family protein n=1 Tax=Xylanibacter muris TaxID=2736290 RepID=A0ABX2AMN5_9BACT|nr:TonB family protein [Xylanibacter muris]
MNKFILVAVFGIVCIGTAAQTFKYKGLVYNVIDESKKEVEVAHQNPSFFDDLKENIVIPAEVKYKKETYKVTQIGDAAFCHKVLNGDDAISTLIRDGAFKLNTGNRLVLQKGFCRLVLPEGLERIGKNAFANFTNLKSINIPSSLHYIDNNAFYGCVSLEEIVLPAGLEILGIKAFYNCRSLRNINIPETVRNIMGQCFRGCLSLEEIKLPDGIDRIGPGVFYGCEKLSRISIPMSVKDISGECFRGCLSLEEINLPNGIDRIGPGAFYDCKALRVLTWPDSLRIIDGHAFENCNSLEKIPIPSKVEYIGEYAFSGCENLVSVKIPGDAQIDSTAFLGCLEMEVEDEVTREILSGILSMNQKIKAEKEKQEVEYSSKLEENYQEYWETEYKRRLAEAKKIKQENENKNVKIFNVVDVMPSFPGGDAALMQYLQKNIKYPVVAEEKGVQGRVLVAFVVECDGYLTDIKIEKSVEPSLDKEARRVVRSMPRWVPGFQNGSPVRVKFTVPVTFRLL